MSIIKRMVLGVIGCTIKKIGIIVWNRTPV